MQDYKLFFFTRKKKEKSVITTHYNKFLNLLMRKGLKNRQISFFLSMLRNHKKKIKSICLTNFNTANFNEIVNGPLFPTFSKLVKVVFRLIALKVELRHRNFRRKEILVPSPVSPWRGMRLGLNLLLKNAATSNLHEKILRKNKKCNLILNEFWRTFRNISTTCSAIEEFTLKVLEHSENFRLTQLFPVTKFRRSIIPELRPQAKKVSRAYFRRKFLLFLSECNLKTKYRRVYRKGTHFKRRPTGVAVKNLLGRSLTRFSLYSRYFLKRKPAAILSMGGKLNSKYNSSLRKRKLHLRRCKRSLGRWAPWKYVNPTGRLYTDSYYIKGMRRFRKFKKKHFFKTNRSVQTNLLPKKVLNN